MTFQELLPGLEKAASVRELLTPEVRKIYEGTAIEFDRMEIASTLREIAVRGRFKTAFDVMLKALERDTKKFYRGLDAEEKYQRRMSEKEKNRMSFDVLDNPHPHLRSFTYSINDDGIYLGDDQICTQPVLIFGKSRNIESGEEFSSLSFFDGYEWKNLTEKRETLFSASKITCLSGYGLSVHSANAQKFIKFVDTFESENRLALAPKLSFSRLGWFNSGQFAPYDPGFTFAGTDSKELYQTIQTSGDMAAWVDHVKGLRKNLQLRLTMAASFASPLIKLSSSLPFVLHLWGLSGTGKTVASMVSASVWGNPDNGQLLRTLDATKNSLVNLAAFFSAIPVFLDELQIAKAEWSSIESLIMALTEGIERSRMKYDKAQPLRKWNCSFLFTGEEPIAKLGSGGGVYNRIIEIECSAPIVEDGNYTANFVRQHHGHAGKIFVDYIRNKDIQGVFQSTQTEIIQQTGATGKQAASMALMLIADKLAGECLFHGESPLTISNVAQYLKTERDVDSSERAYDYICGVIAANKAKFYPDSSYHNGETWGKIEGGVCTFNKVKLLERLKDGGFDFDAVKKKWARNGYLVKNLQDRYATHTSVGGVIAWWIDIVINESGPCVEDDDLLP